MIAPDLGIVRLNLLVELLSECADVTELESLLRIAGGRVRWIVGFDHCTLAVLRGGHYSYWTVTQAEDKLRPVAALNVVDEHRALIAKTLETATAGFGGGRPVRALCAPLMSGEMVRGAICFSSLREGYEYRDLRFVHHIAQCLSSTITRLRLKTDAEDAGRRKDDFLALLGHELRNPLAPIATAVHLLERAKDRSQVLLVDDNEDAADTLAEILRAAGHEVRVAYDGPQALALLDQFQPEVAVLDIGLPVMDGYELAETIQRKLGAETPYLIALTGYGQEGDRQRSRAAGFAMHFVKPVEANDPLEAIAAGARLGGRHIRT
jgi:CheY-like chemotaxis protein